MTSEEKKTKTIHFSNVSSLKRNTLQRRNCVSLLVKGSDVSCGPTSSCKEQLDVQFNNSIIT